MVQEAAYFPSSRMAEALTGQEKDTTTDTADPLPEFAYSYTLPEDLLRPRYLASYLPFQLAYDWQKGENRLHTNDANPVLIFSALQPDVTVWTRSQVMATIYGLAGHIAGPISGRGELIQKNFNLADKFLMDAQAASINGEDFQVEHVPDVIKARGYTGPDNSSRFFYPFGGTFGSLVNG